MARAFDLLVFDWDGTLFLNHHFNFEVMQWALAQVGVPITEEWFAENSGYSARARLQLALDAAGSATIHIEDDGAGLPGDRERILEPYVTLRRGGTGLGLAIVKRILEEHGGTLSLGDRDGGGTVVTLILPANGPPSATADSKDAEDG